MQCYYNSKTYILTYEMFKKLSNRQYYNLNLKTLVTDFMLILKPQLKPGCCWKYLVYIITVFTEFLEVKL